jgi:short-subunit dehydrogenase
MAYSSVLITGATSGIGRAFAKLLPETAALLLTGRRMDRLGELVDELARPERPVDMAVADLAIPADRQALIERAEEARIDLLICNAGVGHAGNFLDNSPEAELETVTVNVTSTVELLRALLPDMINRARCNGRRAGVIVVSSRAAFDPRPGFAAYVASKAFQLNLGQALAEELRRDPIDVLTLCPTYTETEFFARAGLPVPPGSMTAEAVAAAGLAALGRRTVHLCRIEERRTIELLSRVSPSLAQAVELRRRRNPIVRRAINFLESRW